MASFGVVHRFPGGTREQYDAVVAVAHPPDGLPEGQTYHAAGPYDGGWLVTALWESQEAWERFRDETLLPALGSVEGFSGPPEETTFTVHSHISESG